VTDLASLFVWRRDGVVVAAITGEIDISNARTLERDIVAELSDDDAGLVLDLGGLTFLDGSGVHLFYRLDDRVRAFAIVLAEDALPRRVLDLSGSRPATWSHPTEDAAIAAVIGG
jgi:anti-anti-sigma factor